ncbi:hypothetical protein DI09_22p150 [Mitosporidium daphniae]|uniref:Uncharacterized protein n=1 Tax=Mitosporidium daphniae TaxID=1485682 RepID=A0A098VSP3_9MICR|nr:uncharacterized protein DI09_22p150 [Mitosporidium daphniae]KGG51990.1 hypothetical protein DI09_22p150 [Mitosporidium daphniae]|eukprot:XP_013238417.1 uncharacterized protein DI09_22p150 [Mitosporidium daphniae]
MLLTLEAVSAELWAASAAPTTAMRSMISARRGCSLLDNIISTSMPDVSSTTAAKLSTKRTNAAAIGSLSVAPARWAASERPMRPAANDGKDIDVDEPLGIGADAGPDIDGSIVNDVAVTIPTVAMRKSTSRVITVRTAASQESNKTPRSPGAPGAATSSCNAVALRSPPAGVCKILRASPKALRNGRPMVLLRFSAAAAASTAASIDARFTDVYEEVDGGIDDDDDDDDKEEVIDAEEVPLVVAVHPVTSSAAGDEPLPRQMSSERRGIPNNLAASTAIGSAGATAFSRSKFSVRKRPSISKRRLSRNTRSPSE